MLSEHERSTFDQIVSAMGPLSVARRYLMPWWMPPAATALYALILIGAAVSLGAAWLLIGAAGGMVGSVAWGRHRRRASEGAGPIDLWGTPPFIG